jgi:hypothetical protein
MNDNILTQLKTIVERVVRPVTASRRRKRQIREELLAHLTTVFESELATVGNETTALERTQTRFGDSGQLTAEFQKAIPKWDRLRSGFEKLSWEPGDSTARLALKQAVMLLAMSFTLVAAIPLGEFVKGRRDDLVVALQIGLDFGLGMGAFLLPFLVVFLVAPTHLGRQLFGPSSEWSWKFVSACGLASFVELPAMAFFVYWAVTGDFTGSLAHLRFGCLFAPAGPFMFFAVGRQLYKEFSYEREWASLEIDD